MRPLNVALVVGLVGMTQGQAPVRTRPDTPAVGIRLDDLSWPEAEKHLGSDAVVVLPLGAAAKEHGPHLKLRNDLTLAEYLTRRIVAVSPVIVAPPLTYHFYPAFLEYPGSTSLTFATARDLTADVARTLARYGPRRFYVLNTGISTLAPLEATAKLLAPEGVLLRYTDLEARIDLAVRAVQQQPGGTHADEIETSMMLYIDPASVDMAKAVREYTPASSTGPLRLTRRPNAGGTYSASGVWGDPTLATPEKGRVVVEALVAGILRDIEDLRKSTPPPPSAVVQPAAPQAGSIGQGAALARTARCTAGDDRAIRAIGPAFSRAWTNHDAERLAGLWSAEGDIAHPDGMVERSAQVIRQNRASLFQRPEYKNSRHFLTLGNIRCLTPEIAVADGKWELRDVVDAGRQTVPPMEGLFTIVLKKTGGGWPIEAYRYTVTPTAAAAPTLLKRPGLPQ